jgi:hypothetical protein
MKKSRAYGAVASLVLLSCLNAAGRAPVSGLKQEQGQEGRPKFYAARVISDKNVKSAREVLGEPDGHYAEVAPGGQMVLLMENRIYPATTYDDGLVICKGESNYGLEGWFPMSGSQNEPQFAWMSLIRGQSSGGFRVSLVEPIAGFAGVNMIRISNNDAKTLFLDAVIGYSR